LIGKRRRWRNRSF